jgi:hypothetical protein
VRSHCATGCIATSSMSGGVSFGQARLSTPVLSHLISFQWWQGGSGTTAIEIEIGGATLRVAAGVELGFLGKVLRLLKAIK